ncbi:EF-hand domain-containing protein [Roseateles violae]|uniref:EF-hand domain-containing protein n=1 Tax=Roseateles violae TaxID=3058042 RepID=A0ABT8DWE0_9BURK|nr:EF-hand domain-containing protein [Pelomonas sp. PFR6]MDN3922478.1 EF-hand domain-containing protein [Pelomonas sp. PFR6]
MKKSLIGCAAALLATGGALAQSRVEPLADPWLPPGARAAPLAAPSSGAALRAQVMGKLAQQFRQADAAGRGALSLDEARRAGWGFAVQNFQALDSDGRGEIRLQDLQRFVDERQRQR